MSRISFHGNIVVDSEPYEANNKVYCWGAQYSGGEKEYKNNFLMCVARKDLQEKFSSVQENDLISIRGHLGTVWAETEKERICLFVTEFQWIVEEI